MSVLQITTKAPAHSRQTVAIDGKNYPLRLPASLGLKANTFQRLAKRMVEIEALEETPETSTEYEDAADRACRLVLDAPEAVHKKLQVGHRVAVIATYITTLARLGAGAQK